MIKFRALGTEFRVHVLLILAGIVAALLGSGRELPGVMLAVGVHELFHLAAARLCRVEIEHVDIMCFGGAAKIRDIYSVPRLQLAIVAAAGPAANLIMLLLFAALAWWDLLGYLTAAGLIRINLMLMLFNLMPALPLDGGRLLFALTSMWLGRKRALKVGVLLAHVLASALGALAAYGYFAHGVFNLTFVLMGVFLMASSLNELHSYGQTAADRTLTALISEPALPCRTEMVALATDIPMEEAARFISRDRLTLFAMVEGGRVGEILTSGEVARRMLSPCAQK